MKLSEHKDLKEAITALPAKEKDKLLLRLVAKDKILTEHLHFKLLETELDLDARKEAIRHEIEKIIDNIQQVSYRDALYYLRHLTASINHFFKITKDAFGEAELKLLLLNSMPLSFNSPHYRGKDFGFQFAVYFVKSTDAVVKKVQKLHEDLQFDLAEDVNKLLNKIHDSHLAKGAEYIQLPKELDS
ncbi:hypothetical protein ABIB40_003491 [Pedobacter sp. UYP30]|uniref:hypothetical protein n=1 Tax=Pedobacter sp. UYP30 TaxID=1756400 RepID=UPI003397DB5C